jgi:hypothetical protein
MALPARSSSEVHGPRLERPRPDGFARLAQLQVWGGHVWSGTVRLAGGGARPLACLPVERRVAVGALSAVLTYRTPIAD